MAGFSRRIKFVQDGEQVKAGVTNRAPRRIQQNVEYLKQRLDSLAAGEALVAYDVEVEADAKVGMPVYYNATNGRFERCLAGVETSDSGNIQATAASQCWGIVLEKTGPTAANLVVYGVVVGLDLSETIDDVEPSGVYYLSGVEAGKLIPQDPSTSVEVLRVAGDHVFVLPQAADFLKNHEHYRVDLVAEPAGDHTPPGDGGPHVITNADSNQPGWLPASDAIFEGNAPSGAKFGYNLSVDTTLSALWPPLPASSAVLEMSSEDGKIMGRVPADLVTFDRNGIWWMSDCYGNVPWPTTFQNGVSDSASESCPLSLSMRLTLWFTRLTFYTDKTVVTSLTSASDRLVITCLGTSDPKVVGDLMIDLDLDFTGVDDTDDGHLALKEFTDGEFTRGPVAVGIYAASANVSLTSDVAATDRLDPDDEDSPLLYYGKVGVAAETLPTLQAAVQLVRLDKVKERFYKDLMYLAFEPGQDSEFRSRIKVPDDLAISNPQIRLRFILLGRSAGTLPALTLTYRLVTRPEDGLNTPVLLPDADTALPITTAAAVGANEYVEAESDPVTVSPGDIVFFTLSRADDDAYAGEVGVLDQAGYLSSGG